MLNVILRPFLGCVNLPSTIAKCVTVAVRQNAYRCAISKIHRTKYIRRYEVKVTIFDNPFYFDGNRRLGKLTEKAAMRLRRWNVELLNSDGSTIAIRAPEPRYCIQLPLDLKALSESERRKRLAARKKKTIKIKEEVIDDNFDSNEYVNFWKDESSKTVEVTGERKTENL